MKLFDVYPLIDVTQQKLREAIFGTKRNGILIYMRTRQDFHRTFSSNPIKYITEQLNNIGFIPL